MLELDDGRQVEIPAGPLGLELLAGHWRSLATRTLAPGGDGCFLVASLVLRPGRRIRLQAEVVAAPDGYRDENRGWTVRSVATVGGPVSGPTRARTTR